MANRKLKIGKYGNCYINIARLPEVMSADLQDEKRKTLSYKIKHLINLLIFSAYKTREIFFKLEFPHE